MITGRPAPEGGISPNPIEGHRSPAASPEASTAASRGDDQMKLAVNRPNDGAEGGSRAADQGPGMIMELLCSGKPMRRPPQPE